MIQRAIDSFDFYQALRISKTKCHWSIYLFRLRSSFYTPHSSNVIELLQIDDGVDASTQIRSSKHTQKAQQQNYKTVNNNVTLAMSFLFRFQFHLNSINSDKRKR